MSSDVSSAKKASTQAGPSTTLSADDVASYLKAHPDFFADRDSLLAELTVPHESGQAISLLERQVKILRDRSIESRHTLNGLLENARYNDQLFSVTRNLILTLLEEDDLAQLATVTESSLSTQPGIDACRLIVVDTGDVASELQNRFPSLLRSKHVLTQALDKDASSLLFPGTTPSLRSAALCPVTHHHSLLAVLAIGNHAQDYFTDDLDTLFLDFIAEFLGALISQLSKNQK
ncbi:MAG: DUF484 family protein [Pseudohongiella sp.]|uniref:DUF484 family protein n=1 Tax=Pseudohongiella sp. TaxID=1979412 RepID=UPI0034A00B95